MSGKKILVVDDEMSILDMLKDMFDFMDVEADMAATSTEAIEKIKINPEIYNKVLLDLNLPDSTGSESFDKMMEIAPHLNIYIFSGYGKNEITEELIRKGAKGNVPKPFRLEDIKAFINQE